MLKRIGLILLVIVFFPFIPVMAGTYDAPVTKKVMVLDFNPIIESEGGTVRSIMRWSDPAVAEQSYIGYARELSGGYINYTIVRQERNIDRYPVKGDGFTYTDASYMSAVRNPSTHHDPDIINYQQLMTEYHICDYVNRNEIDEVWLWGGPWLGFWEATMAGPGAFHTNAPPITGTTCTRNVHIMGYNYERGPAEMLENLAHRMEGTMVKVFGTDWRWRQSGNDPWGRFIAIEKYNPGNAACGWAHYGPNSVQDYDWANQTVVSSSCDDWYNYPNLTGQKKQINCQVWGCSTSVTGTGGGYMRWLLGHVPKYTGSTDGKWNNWWRYVIDYDCAVDAAKCGTVTPTPPIVAGDLDHDGHVTIFDYNIFVADFGKTGTVGFIPADMDRNGVVDIFDYNVLVEHFGV